VRRRTQAREEADLRAGWGDLLNRRGGAWGKATCAAPESFATQREKAAWEVLCGTVDT
jgi:hypothetical protein